MAASRRVPVSSYRKTLAGHAGHPSVYTVGTMTETATLFKYKVIETHGPSFLPGGEHYGLTAGDYLYHHHLKPGGQWPMTEDSWLIAELEGTEEVDGFVGEALSRISRLGETEEGRRAISEALSIHQERHGDR